MYMHSHNCCMNNNKYTHLIEITHAIVAAQGHSLNIPAESPAKPVRVWLVPPASNTNHTLLKILYLRGGQPCTRSSPCPRERPGIYSAADASRGCIADSTAKVCNAPTHWWCIGERNLMEAMPGWTVHVRLAPCLPVHPVIKVSLLSKT